MALAEQTVLSTLPGPHTLQFVHRVAPAPVWNVPAPQVLHPYRPALVATVPGPHAWQTPSAVPLQPIPHTRPGAHALHALHAVWPDKP